MIEHDISLEYEIVTNIELINLPQFIVISIFIIHTSKTLLSINQAITQSIKSNYSS